MSFEIGLIKDISSNREFVSALKVIYKSKGFSEKQEVFLGYFDSLEVNSISSFLIMCSKLDNYLFFELLRELEVKNRMFFEEMSFYLLRNPEEDYVVKFNEKLMSIFRLYKASQIFGKKNIDNFKIKVN